MKLIARFIPMAFLLGACMYAQQPQDPQQQPTTPPQPSTQQPTTPVPGTPAPSTAPSTDLPASPQSTPTSQQPATPAASENQPTQDLPKTDVTITGKVVKSKGGLAIHDTAGNAMYKVDNEDQLKQFMGKNVKVTGTLDAQTKTIHISNVEIAAL